MSEMKPLFIIQKSAFAIWVPWQKDLKIWKYFIKRRIRKALLERVKLQVSGCKRKDMRKRLSPLLLSNILYLNHAALGSGGSIFPWLRVATDSSNFHECLCNMAAFYWVILGPCHLVLEVMIDCAPSCFLIPLEMPKGSFIWSLYVIPDLETELCVSTPLFSFDSHTHSISSSLAV